MKHAVAVGLLVALLIACQGSSSEKPKPIGSEPPIVIADAEPEVAIDAPPMADPEPPDPGKLIADLGAIPAWQAVIDRAQLLARRGLRGVVYGRIGPAVMQLGPTPEPAGSGAKPIDAGLVPSPYVWLVDDSEGNGTLGIRVQVDDPKAKEGDRVALAGSWLLDEQKRWYWKVDTVTPLPAAPASDIPDPVAPVPTHEIGTGSLPAGARTITVARDNDLVYFQLVGPPPVRDGDGWLVANELGDVPFARLQLPGERSSYGAQDMRAPDERWQLKRAQTYWVRIGKIRKSPKPDEPANINARTAPVLLK